MHQEEHGGCVRRSDRCAHEKAFDPVQVKGIDRRRCDQRRSDQYADGRERAGRGQHAAEGHKTRAQTAVEQDQRQRDRADRESEPHIVEMDSAGPGLAGQHADHNEDQQQRSAEAQRDQT